MDVGACHKGQPQPLLGKADTGLRVLGFLDDMRFTAIFFKLAFRQSEQPLSFRKQDKGLIHHVFKIYIAAAGFLIAHCPFENRGFPVDSQIDLFFVGILGGQLFIYQWIS